MALAGGGLADVGLDRWISATKIVKRKPRIVHHEVQVAKPTCQAAGKRGFGIGPCSRELLL